MAEKIRIGIVGYGNLGKGAELAIRQTEDMELVGVFSRRQLSDTVTGVPVIHVTEAQNYKDKIDVMLLCGGSATDLIEQGPQFAAMFNTVDSFDTHAKIPEYFDAMDTTAKTAKTTSIISVGWDPGLFSLNRLLFSCVLPNGKDYTFWGKGVSQGHSDALRRIPGVKNAKQYTIPLQDAIDKVRSGLNPDLSTEKSHIRDCYVVAQEGADRHAIETSIKTMPHYFAGYETYVNFISEEEFNEKHSGIPHGGFVFRSGITGNGTKHIMEFNLNLESNPEFTSGVMVAYARAALRMAKHGHSGALTVFDVPFAWLSPKDPAQMRKELL